MGCGSLRDVEIHHTRLNDGDSILDVDREDAIHPLQLKDDAALNGKRASAQTCTRASGQEWDAVFIGETNDLRNLFRCPRKDDHIRPVFEERQTVAFVDQKLGLIFNHCGRFENLPQPAYDFLVHGYFCCSLSFSICSFTKAACGWFGFVAIIRSQYSKARFGSFLPCSMVTPMLNSACAFLGSDCKTCWNSAIASSNRSW